MSQPTVFVSGGAGFVGTAVIRELLRREYPVRALVHHCKLAVEDQNLRVYRGEMDNSSLLAEALQGCGAAIHLVGIIAENPAKRLTFAHAHIALTRAIIEACQATGVRRYIHMSALGARLDAPSRYHRTKAAAEQLVRQSSLQWTIFRPSLIHGPGGEFTRQMLAWLDGKKAPWYFMPYFGAGWGGGGAKCLLQPVDVRDVARAFVDALGNPRSVGNIYDLGGATRLAWPELYQLFARVVRDREARVIPIPAWFAAMLARSLPAGMLPFSLDQVFMSQEHNIADLEAFQADFGYLPRGFEAGVMEYAAELDKPVMPGR